MNRYCIKTAVTTLHNQLQRANMSHSMVKKQKTKNKKKKKQKTALLQYICLQNSWVDSLVNFVQPTCPLVAQMFYNILLYISICVRYVTKMFKISGTALI